MGKCHQNRFCLDSVTVRICSRCSQEPTSKGWSKSDDENQILYKYYEKPLTTNTTILKDSVMAKVQTMANDLLNTREGLPDRYRADVIDTSGYGYDQVRRIVMSGAKGYLAKWRRRTQNGGKLHRTAEESSSWRWRKKSLGKSSWFKDSRAKDEPPKYTREEHGSMRDGSRVHQGAEKKLRTRAVCFVEQTPHGELVKRMREQLANLAPTLGYRVRVVERTGIKMVSSFPQSSAWRGEKCGRGECITCNQDIEDLPDCTRPSVV